MEHTLTIRNYILTTILAHGGDWEEVEDALFEALLPRNLAAKLNVSAETWRFTFDPEVKAEEPDADLMVFGNPILDRLLDFGVEKGGVSEVYISGMYLDDPRIPTQVERAITVAGADLALGDARPCNVRFARFLFQITFLTDVREEELRSVTVNLATGELERRLETVLPDITLAPFPQQGIPDAPTISVVDAYLTARIEILRQMTSPYRELIRALKRRQREEKRRIQAFHEGYRDEQELLKERYGKYPERVAVIDAK
ncbi:MAG: hypothetical protein IH861_14560, partial [Chloroflexi bacterium]|nr:hypothetical protein [Chloroflexota bacterium]